MKQILQSLKTGKTEVVDVPVPVVTSNSILMRSTRTLVSTGTERMLVNFGKAGLIDKARQQPDKVMKVLNKLKTDGLLPTIETVLNKLDQPLSMGYCNVGIVKQIGAEVGNFEVGDRVASNGKHAEVVNVPANLCAKVPDGVSDDEAAFTVLGAVALQGIRLIQPTLGESIVVTGLGLIGLMAVQLLRAHGCRVLGVDINPQRLELASQFGAETVDLSIAHDPIVVAQTFSRYQGVDAVIITASTKSSEPIHQAAQMCRKRGRIVLVGVTGLELSRADFYEKELSFQVSCSYGPGRYDPSYEEKGFDYPIGFVRWTEQRNFEAILDMMAAGSLDVKPLISHRFSIDDAEKAYEIISQSDPSLGILLDYPGAKITSSDQTVRLKTRVYSSSGQKHGVTPTVSFIGSGNYATGVLIPAFKGAGADLHSVVSNTGVSGIHAGNKFGFEETTTDVHSVFQDQQANAIVIATRHDSHADLVCQALQSDKHVFVEKPLAVNLQELQSIVNTYETAKIGKQPLILMVGFNRRFSPHIQKIKSLLSSAKGPKTLVMTVNAGTVPIDHWIQDSAIGGGRIIGEACHYIDLLRHLADENIADYSAMKMKGATNDTVVISLSFRDGSLGTVHYVANGNRSFPKERLEIFTEGKILQLSNFRKLRGYGWSTFKSMNLWRQDKGQRNCVSAFLDAVRNGSRSPIPLDELIEVSRFTIEVAEQLH